MFDNDPEFLTEIVSLFLETYPQLLSGIEEAISKGDAAVCAGCSHLEGGAVANFGAKPWSKSRGAGAMGKTGDLSSAADGSRALQALLNGFEPELRSALETGNGTGCDVKILIAEDDAISRRLLDTILRKWGYEFVVAQDGGKPGRSCRRRTPPRLAILDWMMPEMDGVEVAASTRPHDSPYVYILLLSAKSQREDLVKGMESGADDYITKPFDANELKVRLRAGRRILDLQTQLMSAQEALRTRRRVTADRNLNRNAIFDIFRASCRGRSGNALSSRSFMIDIDQLQESERHLRTYGGRWRC